MSNARYFSNTTHTLQGGFSLACGVGLAAYGHSVAYEKTRAARCEVKV